MRFQRTLPGCGYPPDPTQWKYEKNGLPRLRQEQIESMARALLRRVDPSCLITPGPVPMLKVLEQVIADTGLKYDFVDLGPKKDLDLRGVTRFKTGEILLDETLKSDGRTQFLFFTIAHELGHWLIQRHQPIFLGEPGVATEDLEDEVGNFFIGANIPNTTRRWVEWQANQFASSLILPYEAVAITMKEANESFGNYGERATRIYINQSREGVDLARRILQQIALKFMVSWKQVEMRLSTLGFLEYQNSAAAAHPLFKSEFEDVVTDEPEADSATEPFL